MRTFRTEDRKLFDFLDSRGHTDWRMRNINGVYVAFFSDSKRLQDDIAVYKRTRSTASDSGVIRTWINSQQFWSVKSFAVATEKLLASPSGKCTRASGQR